MTSFGKIRVEGRDACAYLQYVCANELDVAPGRIVYTQMLNARGGIESDLTVTRLSETAFLLVVPGATLQRDLAWLRRHLGDRFAVITDVTSAEAVLCVMGPEARDLMRAVSPDDFGNAAHPYGTAREIEIGMGLARAHRVSYVGELGWEIYVPTDQAAHVFEALEEAGAPLGLTLCGLHALDSCRIEKAYRHFGHDITDEDHVLEAGLGFAVRTAKGDFIGREAVLRKREAGLDRRLLQFRLEDPAPLLFHNEAVVRDGRIVGPVTSGNYGHFLGGAIGMAYVPCTGESESEVLASAYEIEIAGRRHRAVAALAPMHDPRSERVRA
jgi:4-methylaminobutanoate oxidase (formaldehyde-forming)